MTTVDALITGAGPAGTSCALALARSGWRVVIIDKATFPRHKTCGGFIGPENKALLTDLGIWSKLLEKGACIVGQSILTASRGALTIMPIEGVALGVSRQLLDTLLLDRVKAAGVGVYEGAQVRNLYNHGGGFNVLVDHYGDNLQLNICARHIIDASGHRSPQGGLKNIQLGIAALYENMPQASGRVMLHCCQGGHVGINPFENQQVNVCYVVDAKHFETKDRDPQRILADWVQENPHLRKVMQGAKRVSSWKAVYIPRRKTVTLFENGVWRAGDVAAFIDTATGGGISVALLSGQLLAMALTEYERDEDRLKVYTHEYLRHFSWQRRLAALFGDLVHRPWLADSIIRLLDINYRIRRAAMSYSRPMAVIKSGVEHMKDERSFV